MGLYFLGSAGYGVAFFSAVGLFLLLSRRSVVTEVAVSLPRRSLPPFGRYRWGMSRHGAFPDQDWSAKFGDQQPTARTNELATIRGLLDSA